MIRTLIVDDHPAVRAGLKAVMDSEPGIVPLGAACSAADLPPALHRTRPDVVILDYHLPGEDGLMVCLGIKAEMPPPGVLLYSAYADASLIVPALLAGVDGIVSKGAPAAELFDAIRRVARGEPVLPPVPRELLEAAAKRLDAEDQPILAMLVHGTPRGDVAAVLGLEPLALAARVKAMVGRLAVEVPLAASSPGQGTMSPRRMA